VKVNDAGKRAIQAADELTVTVVPIIEPLPYENIDKKHVEDPLEVGYVRVVGYK
jgi:hypothetical protein